MFNQLLVQYGHILGLFDILPIFSLFFSTSEACLLVTKIVFTSCQTSC